MKETRDFTFEKMLSYNKKPLVNNSLSKKFKENLRQNLFDICDNNYKGDVNYFNTTYSRYMTPNGQKNYQSVYDSNFGNKNLMDGNYYINNNDKKIFDNISIRIK